MMNIYTDDLRDLAGVCPLQEAGEEVGQAPFVGSGLYDDVRLLHEDDVLHVHQVLRVLEDLRSEPSAVAEEAVLFEEVVVGVKAAISSASSKFMLETFTSIFCPELAASWGGLTRETRKPSASDSDFGRASTSTNMLGEGACCDGTTK
eukprot:CAMPEP_0206566298 /NCGR_PEP_ID=MMETSP0325_2-20121206/24583_1 /ASSEMBLY_ACC=CAM_ASM_000347 /TAXON_ID=2866 /ORGANISM="Crypthecodinium cohnii, Strain Seligo" /LENGTH=147 /DNA_ID=CAMNT_0054069317 /DNA_START=576 /DNA_END=1020 /DNA_ORIENTATION=-